jgi:superfamily II DNA or RNA helicase
LPCLFKRNAEREETPSSYRGKLVQYVGRILRHHPGREQVEVYDYVDRDVPVLSRMLRKREPGYRALKFNTNGSR